MDQQTRLYLKPDAQMTDLDFKLSTFKQIENIGDVVGAFENEIPNINSMAERFPNAVAVLLETKHSKSNVAVLDKIHRIKDYRSIL